MKETAARRLARIPPYLFSELDRLKAATRGGVIDLGEGSPDIATPAPIVRALVRALKKTANHGYPTYAGKLSCRRSLAAWYRRRFGVRLDPEAEACMLLGSKEGVGHLIWGICGPGDTVACTDPAYPIYPNQTRLAGARMVSVALRAKNGFLPDLDRINRIGPRIKLLCLTYPNNPTAAVASLGFYRDVVSLARKHGFFVLNDCVYSELYFGRRPPSILQVPGARRCCVEFHSLSKTFSMAGWRIGSAAGNRELVRALLRIKQNTDSGPFGAIQDAAAYALDHAESLSRPARETYRRRRDVFCEELSRSGWDVPVPAATFYVWVRVPARRNPGIRGSKRGTRPPEPSDPGPSSPDYRFVLDMLRECRVVAAPGVGFGRYGRGYIRFALVQSEERLRIAARRIGRWLNRK